MQVVGRNKLTLAVIFASLLFATSASAQSTNQDFPTPVTTTEITGTIKPRDVGDSRLTSYFYRFDGSQGDLFINIVTKNFTGDIDVFTLNGLRPMTKVVVYADFAENETGRVIYLRKPEKLMLRVQGRPPGDDPATFRIKFAGSFVASTETEPALEPTLPSLTEKNESGIRVNSVGTIVEVIPKATPTPPPPEVARDVSEERKDTEKQETAQAAVPEKSLDAPSDVPEKKVEVVVTENMPETSAPAVPTLANRRSTRRNRRTTRPPATKPVEEAKPDSATAVTEPPKTPPARTRRGRPAPTDPKAPDPLEKVNLVIVFKDGNTIQRPMSEVLRFTVDKGILTVIAKDGSIGRYSIVDVAKVTIE